MTPDEIIREHMRKLGAKGGKRSLETMTAKQRQARSAKGGAASKGKPKRARKLTVD